MAGETGGSEAQGAGEATQPQGGQSSTAQGAESEGETPPADGAMTVEVLARKNAELEADNRKYRQQAKQREEADKAKAAAGLSESERLKAENVTLLERAITAEKRAQEQSLRSAATEAATRLGFRNPAIAVGLIASRVEFGEDGEPTNVDSLLTALSKSDAYLLTTTDFGGGARGTSPAAGQAQTMNDIIRGAAGSSSR